METLPRTSDEYKTWWASQTDIPYGHCWCGCGETTSLAPTSSKRNRWIRHEPIRYLPNHYVKPLRAFQVEQICNFYESGHSMKSLVRDFAVSPERISQILRSAGISERSWKSAIKLSHNLFSDTQDAEIKSRYIQGESAIAIAHSLNVSETAVRNALVRTKTTMRTSGEAKRLYTCNHRFFQKMNSEAEAYWCGFLAADGYIHKNSVILTISPKDRDHLTRFQAALQSDHPIKEYEFKSSYGGRACRYEVCSPQLVASLAEYGVVSRKTFTLGWPQNMPAELVRHYLRGYSDGDGSFVSTQRKDKPQWRAQLAWAITASESFAVDCRHYLAETTGFNYVKLINHPTSKMKILRYGGNSQIARLARLLYDGATVYLPRKREKVAHFLKD